MKIKMSHRWTILTILAFLTIFSSSILFGNGQEYDDEELIVVIFEEKGPQVSKTNETERNRVLDFNLVSVGRLLFLGHF